MVIIEDFGEIMTQEEFLAEFAVDNDSLMEWTEEVNNSFNQKYAA